MEIREKIKSAGLKATPQRRAIYEVMQELCHCPIDEVIARIREEHPDVTISTVYRIMDSFCEAGLLTKFVNSDGKTIFDITPGVHHHIHTADDEYLDIADRQLSDLIRRRVISQIPEDQIIDKISIHVTTKPKEKA